MRPVVEEKDGQGIWKRDGGTKISQVRSRRDVCSKSGWSQSMNQTGEHAVWQEK
jgi:hypothetical protein